MNWNTAATFAIIAENEELTVEQIAERLELSTDTVSRSIDTLQTDGYLAVERVNGKRNAYTILRVPPLLDRITGWFYRFKTREFWRRIMVAKYADEIYHKAGRVQRIKCDDPAFNTRRNALWEKYPEIRDVFAVWELETAIEIVQVLDELLEWSQDGQIREVATVPAQARDDRC